MREVEQEVITPDFVAKEMSAAAIITANTVALHKVLDMTGLKGKKRKKLKLLVAGLAVVGFTWRLVARVVKRTVEVRCCCCCCCCCWPEHPVQRICAAILSSAFVQRIPHSASAQHICTAHAAAAAVPWHGTLQAAAASHWSHQHRRGPYRLLIGSAGHTAITKVCIRL
jgi:hypothetical protein